MLIRYIIFAFFAAAVNIGVQWLVIWVCETGLPGISGPVAIFFQDMIGLKPDSLFLYSAMAGGTISGLVFKYFLDKNFVFEHRTTSGKQEASTFFLYSVMGVLTTFVFWGVELGFHYVIGTEEAKYIGAALGLTIGYIVKFFLDRKFVFTKAEQ